MCGDLNHYFYKDLVHKSRLIFPVGTDSTIVAIVDITIWFDIIFAGVRRASGEFSPEGIRDNVVDAAVDDTERRHEPRVAGVERVRRS